MAELRKENMFMVLLTSKTTQNFLSSAIYMAKFRATKVALSKGGENYD